MANNRGQLNASSNDPYYAGGLLDPFLFWEYELEMNANPLSHGGDNGVHDLENYQALSHLYCPALPIPEDDTGLSSRASLNHQSAPSSIRSLDGPRGMLPVDERSVVHCQEEFVRVSHNATSAFGITSSWTPIADNRLTGTYPDLELPFSFSADGGDNIIRKRDVSDGESNSSYFCNIPDCKAAQRRTRFSRRHDLRRHVREQHSSEGPRFTCVCCRKLFVRKDKITSHLRSVHSIHEDASRYYSSELGRIEEISQDVHSAVSQPEPNQQQVEVHTILDAIIFENKSERIQPPNSDQYNHLNDALSSNTLPKTHAGAKHTISGDPQPELMRGKRRTSTNYSLNETPKGARYASAITISKNNAAKLVQQETAEVPYIDGESGHCGQCLQPLPELASQSSSTDTMTLPHPNPEGHEEISNVSLMDMLDLLRLDGLQMTLEGLELSRISFNCSEKVIKLQGPSPVTKRAKADLEKSLKEARRITPTRHHSSMSNHGALITKHSARFKSKLSASSCFSSAPTKIFPIGTSGEDCEVLTTWMKYIAPVLGDILTPAVGGNHSASLVRQGESVESSILSIRIQSTSGQSEEVQGKIREQVYAVCEQHGRATIPLHFSQGSIVLLSGSWVDARGYDLIVNKRERFPHHRRFWRHPGMGASIGPGSCKTVSATLGGYISIDRQKYMLTVDHFIDYAIGMEVGNEMSQMIITSPSLLDVEELTEDLNQSVRDNEAMIEKLIKQNFPSGPTLEQFLCHAGITTLRENRESLNGFLRDLSREAKDFSLGKIHGRCVSQLREATRPYKLPPPEHENIPIRHRMDWSVSTVNWGRQGQNRHRHKFCTESETVDFLSERLYPYGTGNLCQLTCDVEPNMPVHYVGQSSGRQSGKTSAGLELITRNGKSSLEWAMVVPEDKQQKGEIYCGDSGAWIIRDSDSALVGLLWGWSNGNLIFTPINDIFEDIAETFNATEVCLLKPSTGPDHGSALTQNPTAPQAQNICRVKGHGSRKPRSWPLVVPYHPSLDTSNDQPPRADPISIGPLADSGRVLAKKADSVFLNADTTKDQSPSPIPSLTSLISSSQQTTSCSPSLVGLQSQADCTLDTANVILSEDGDVDENSKIKEEPQSYSQLLHMFGKLLGKSGTTENRLSLGYIFDNKSFSGA